MKKLAFLCLVGLIGCGSSTINVGDAGMTGTDSAEPQTEGGKTTNDSGKSLKDGSKTPDATKLPSDGGKADTGRGGSCASPLTICSGSCTATQSDPENCGSCANKCSAGDYCAAGACSPTCPLTVCASTCTDTAIDPANCGACGKSCGADQVCQGGVCSSTSCEPFETTCGVPPNGYCAAIQTDPKNCGGCGFACPSGDYCSEGQCAAACLGVTSTLCTGTCVDTQSDNKNCGACGTACPSGQVCSAGSCTATCNSGYATCGTGGAEYCAATRVDPENCGACATVCPSGEVCSGGTCAAACAGAVDTLCNGLCVDVDNNNENCGACGTTCAAGTVCSAGQCAATCTTGYATCGTGATEYCSVVSGDPLNCGICGTTCTTSQVCAQGKCGTACSGLKGTSCGGTCTDLTTDPENCGSCGFTCDGGTVCTGGLCAAKCDAAEYTCPAGTGSVCVDINVDPNNCDGCGIICAAGTVCSLGQCGPTCDSSYTTCTNGGVPFCTDINTDPNNCGACGTACSPPANGAAISCTFGACGYQCHPGYAAINDNNACIAFVQVTEGRITTCGLSATGDVYCWGDNTSGQLGDGTVIARPTPVKVLGLSGPATKVSVGRNTTCALLKTGAIQCWGDNTYGELGNNTTAAVTPHSTSPVTVTGFSSGAVDIELGAGYACALDSNSGVRCWGYNAYGQLGNNTTTNSLTPALVTTLSGGVKQIGVSKDLSEWDTTCVPRTQNLGTPYFYCDDFNANGCYYNGNTGVTCVLGGATSCAVTTTGALVCWGDNAWGQLGNNTTVNSSVPVAPLGVSSGIAAVAVGGGFVCAVTTQGAVNCTGYNSHGQLGNGGTTNALQFGPVSGLNGGVVGIAAGDSHTCVLTKTNTNLCWGFNQFGQVGDGTTTDRTSPVAVQGLPAAGITGLISVGGHDSCAISNAGPTVCWGDNDSSQLAQPGTITQLSVPTAIQP